jgi:hypothetical protein
VSENFGFLWLPVLAVSPKLSSALRLKKLWDWLAAWQRGRVKHKMPTFSMLP